MLWRNIDQKQEGENIASVYRITLLKGEWIDADRKNRTVPYKIYAPDLPPEFDGKLPVILWSHGYGGSRDGASFLSRYLAEQGYVVVHITHLGTDSSLWEGKPEHPWDILRQTEISRETTINRFKDVPFALDRLQGKKYDDVLDEKFRELLPFLNTDLFGMSGHSFGALTTQIMGGQLYPDYAGHLKDMSDARIAAGMSYSPIPRLHVKGAEMDKIFGKIHIPMFYMTGTEDTSPLENFSYERRLEVFKNTTHADKHLLVKEGGDHMVYNGTRGKLGQNPKRKRHEEIIKVGSLAYWDTMLKDDDAAREWLTNGGFEAFLGDDGSYVHGHDE